MVILSVSGHCGLFCDPFQDNHAYLGDPGGAVEALVQTFTGLGLADIEVAHFSDRFDELDRDGDGRADELGFLQLLDAIEHVYENWIDGVADPARLVIVGHSHGATWAHIAVGVTPHVPVDYLVTLDGICFEWEPEHNQTISDWFAAQPGGNPFPWDISTPCDRWTIPGLSSPLDTKDVPFDHVAWNLEVQGNTLLLQDCCDNRRLDGSTTGIETFPGPDGHSEVDEANSVSMAWVADRIVARETAP